MPISFPSSNEDPIIRLHDYYFQPADLMYENVKKIFLLHEKAGKLTNRNVIRLQSYGQLWLTTLYVVAEGFKHPRVERFFKDTVDRTNDDDLTMIVHWGSVHYQLGQLGEQLKSYRNVTFHFQETMTRLEAKRASFLEYEGRHRPIQWACDLHIEMRWFFSKYRPRAAAMKMHQQWLAEISENSTSSKT